MPLNTLYGSKETGHSAKTHIHDFLVDKAKHLLLNSDDSVSNIAYVLGFNYPHYFGRLFKKKTGQLITGQNPNSATQTTLKALEKLKKL